MKKKNPKKIDKSIKKTIKIIYQKTFYFYF